MDTSALEVPESRVRMELRNRLLGPVQASSSNGTHDLVGLGGPTDFSVLSEVCKAIQASRNGVGSFPPVPQTLRGRAGSIAVRMIARALSWYTPQIANFHSLVARHSREVLQSLKRLQIASARSEAETTLLNEQVAALLTSMREFEDRSADRSQAMEHTIQSLQAEVSQLRGELERVRQV